MKSASAACLMGASSYGFKTKFAASLCPGNARESQGHALASSATEKIGALAGRLLCRLRGFALFLVLALASAMAWPAPTPADVSSAAPNSSAHRLLFIATSNVPKGKFRQLQQIAAPHGLAVEVRYLNTIPAQSGPSIWTATTPFSSTPTSTIKFRSTSRNPCLG